MDKEEIEKLYSRGFDRGIVFSEIKAELLDHQHKHFKNIKRKHTNHERKILFNKLCYIFISLLQLRNGSRISEACDAFITFCGEHSINEKVYVKIAKSKKDTDKIKTKTRYRKMIFAHDWINLDAWKYVQNSSNLDEFVQNSRLEKRVLDYLLTFCNTNTHSLRYAYINHMLTDLKIEMNIVAKLVGHVNCNQLVTYTSKQNVDLTLDIEI